MPHSSGGFHGGGFHGGGGWSGHHYGRSHANNGMMVSRFRFPGSTAWLYYTSRGVPHIVYSTTDITKMPKGGALGYVLLGIFAVLPLAFLVLTGIKHPQPISLNYNTTAIIDDGADVISDSEEVELMSIFDEFRKVSGVTPSIKTVCNDDWRDPFYDSFFSFHEYTLEDYAYSSYLNAFSDESHWLLVYACDRGTSKGDKALEGMQGDNTDTILFGNVTERFNHELYNALEGDSTVGESFVLAFNAIIPELLDVSFYADPEMVTFTVVWELIIGLMVAVTIANQINAKHYATAQKIENPESIVMTKCKHCGASYYKGTVTRCPKCGRSVVMDDELNEKF